MAASRRPLITESLEIQILTYNIMADPLATKFPSRLSLIIEAIKSATPASGLRVLHLQEVNDESLPLILKHPYIQASFPFSTHTPSSLLPSHRNLLTLVSKPFRYSSLPFLERHKSALIVALDDVEIDLVNVHLTSSLTDQAVKSKLSQMRILKEFLMREGRIERTVFVAGDFNLTSSSRTIETALAKGIIKPETAKAVETVIDPDFWVDAFDISASGNPDLYEGRFKGERGATFDRLTNSLAALTDSPIENRPERYDRVLLQKGRHVKLKYLEIVGLPTDAGECGSDHYGLSVVAQIDGKSNIDIHSIKAAVKQFNAATASIELVEDITDIEPLLLSFLPTDEDREKRYQAIALLETTLRSTERTASLVLAPLGSYLMETYFPESDVDMLAIGSVSSQTFFDLASYQLKSLQATGDDGFKGVHFVNSLVSIIEVWVLGIKFDLQYCEAPELLTRYDFLMVVEQKNILTASYRYHSSPSPDLMSLVFDSTLISSLSPSSLRPLNTYRDTAYLLTTIPDIPSYQTAHRYLSLYLKRRGLYSAKFGYLGGIHLSLMLNRVVKLIHSKNENSPEVEENVPISSATIIRTYFSYYGSLSWAEDNITDPTLPDHQNISRSLRDAILIQSIHVPTARKNVASSCSKLTAQTLSREFKLASEMLQRGEWEWCLRPKEVCIQDFLNDFGAFIRVEVDVWDVDDIGGDKVREMIGGLESRFPKLLVSLGRVEGLDGRVWPERFCLIKDGKKEVGRRQEREFKGYYLIGVSAREEEMDSQRKKLFSGKVITAMREFDTSVNESREFQGGNIWVSMELVPRKKILETNLVLDEKDWGSSEQPTPIQELEDTEPGNHVDFSSMVASKRSSRRSAKIHLRPAQDIISRIHWDPLLAADNFLIGYEDRFIGVKEIELGKWKSEQTDEEFIPMHRIVWVRKSEVAGGGKVWDRREKLDLIFGSGVSKANISSD